jgi:Ca-activated chloride channel family protein
MEPTDIYSLVAFSDHARVIVEAQHVLDRSAILTKIDGIFEQGGTNLHAGLELGAQQVRSELAGGARGRIVLLSDGHANVGITSPSAFIRQASELSSKGISVSAIGLGLDYNEDTLASIADAGGGTYGYVADPADLVDVFTEELSRTAAMVARELRVDLTFAEGVQPIEVLGWSSSVADDTWTVSMGDINAGETRQLIAKVRIQGEVEGEIPILSLGARYRDLTTDKLATVSIETSAQVTQSAAIVKASTDLEAAQQATRAWGNWYLDQSARAFADGDASHAQDLANQASVVLRQGATTFASPEMLEDAVQCDEAAQTYASAPLTSDEAKHVIKKSKEQFRVRARH